MLLLVLLAVKIYPTFGGNERKTDPDPYPYFNTFTPYRVVRGHYTEMAGCEVEKIWVHIRHGTRYAYPDQSEEFLNFTTLRDTVLQNHRTHKRGSLTNQELSSLENWTFKEKLNESALLTPSGREDLIDIGRTLQRQYHHLLGVYDPDKVKFNTSLQERSQESAKAVIEGLWGGPVNFTKDLPFADLITNDDECIVHLEKTDPRIFREYALFMKADEMRTVISDVNNRLGYINNQIPLDLLRRIWDLCAYENAWYVPKRSPWCSAFSRDNLKVLEYAKDLKHYYKNSHGNPIAPHIACKQVIDIISAFESDRPATVHNGHSFSNRMLLTALGIGKLDELPTAKDYEKLKNRTWRLSMLNPFGATTTILLNRCGSDHSVERKISVFLSENPYPLEACGNQYSCSFEQFKSFYVNKTKPEFCNRNLCVLEQNKKTKRSIDKTLWEQDFDF